MEYAKSATPTCCWRLTPTVTVWASQSRTRQGEYELPTGNQTGMLLLDYICSQRVKHGKTPADPVMVKTIVTMDMGEQIAAHYGLRTINVLTGFKFIGSRSALEHKGADSYVFGFGELRLPDRLLRPRQGRRGRRVYDLQRCSATMPPRASACWTSWRSCIRPTATA